VSDVGQISDFRTLLSTLSADALTRGKQFERVTKWWLENDPIHSRQIEKVWLWDEWPEYPGRDIGIDLVARLLDGSLMAVQAKCVDESRSIPKSELDSFVSAASSSTFKHKMLLGTGKNSARTPTEWKFPTFIRTQANYLQLERPSPN